MSGEREVRRYRVFWTTPGVAAEEAQDGAMCYYSDVERVVEGLRAERDQWKANHDNAQEIKRAVLGRPDLGERAALVQKLVAERDAALLRVGEAEGMLPKWIMCRDRLPECKEPCESMWGGQARSDTCLVMYADDMHQDSTGPHISTAFLLDYSDDQYKHYEWVYPIDRSGGLERCASHGGPVPIAWMPLPEGTMSVEGVLGGVGEGS